MSEMWALSVKQPWLQAIVDGVKTVENRGKRPPAGVLGMRILLVGSKATDAVTQLAFNLPETHQARLVRPWAERLYSEWVRSCLDAPPLGGYAACTAHVVGLIDPAGEVIWSRFKSDDGAIRLARGSGWYADGQIGIVLGDVRVVRPVQVQGKPGWFKVNDMIVEEVSGC